MAERIILHVGMPKCGTSTVQNAFAAQRKLLYQNGVDYIDFGPVDLPHLRRRSTGNSNNIVYALAGELQESFGETMERISKFFLESTAQTIILSHEDFVTFDKTHLEILKRSLSSFANNIIPIIYIRDHVSWLSSDYQQHVKQLRSTEPIGVHVGKRLTTLSFSSQCKKLKDVFGNVLCRFLQGRIDIANDFLKAIDHPVHGLSDLNKYDSNVSLSKEGVEILLSANASKLEGDEYKAAYKRAFLASKSHSKYFLPKGLAQAVAAYSLLDLRGLKPFLSKDDWSLLERKLAVHLHS